MIEHATDQAAAVLSPPEVSVVVASHRRAGRLATCLEALAGQTLDRERWEVVVVHTYDPEVAARVIDTSELAQAGRLRQLPAGAAVAHPSLQRNIGWRAARAPLVAFTDDDCRPERDWLERLVEAAQANPGAIVQGATRPDPREEQLLYKAHVRTLAVDPPGRFTQTCNILYSRAVLARLGGFDECAITGEDIDLAIRAREAGAPLVGAPEALVYHAIESMTLAEKMRSNQKWQHLAYVVKKHPRLRADCHMRIWWKSEHLCATVALAGVVTAVTRQNPPIGLAATIPYFVVQRDLYGRRPVGRLRVIRRLPELWLVDLAEIGVFIRGSLRYRTLLL